MKTYPSSQASLVDSEQEYYIACQIHALHEFIGKSIFTHEVISKFHHELFRPSSSTSNQNETLERYIKSLSTVEEHRLNNELRIYDYTGQVSTFFVRDQELNASEAEELFLILDEWVSSVKTTYFAPHCSQEVAAHALQSEFDFFRKEHGFRFWDQQKLKAMRYSLLGDCAACEDLRSLNPVSFKATGMIHGQITREKQKMSLSSEEASPGKRARPFNNLYDTKTERKKLCLVSREIDSQGVTVEVREVDPTYDMDEQMRSVDMDLC